MEAWILLFSLLVFLFGVFVLKKLWLGALAAIAVQLLSKCFFPSETSLLYPFANGFIISAELGLLLFGSYLFYDILSTRNHFEELTKVADTFSSKLSIIIILCWFMGSFMEGITGFGIPAMLVAPLLLRIGFRPLTCIVLPLAANTAAVTFGALGTPFKIGLEINTITPIVYSVVVLNAFAALFVPFVLAFLYSKTEGVKLDWGKEWLMLLGAGFCFSIPYGLVGLYSIDYPAVAAGGVGLLLFVLFFIPKDEKPSIRFWLTTFSPYLMLIVLLLILKYTTHSVQWKVNNYLKVISLYQPGVVFILASIITLAYFHYPSTLVALASSATNTAKRVGKTLGAIVILVCFTQLIQQDITLVTHNLFTAVNHDILLLFFTPIMGVTGSFITGSATMSNLLLHRGIQTLASAHMSLQMALLHTGSAIGNAISIQNILLVKTTINDSISISKILGFNLLTIAFYLLSILLASVGVLWYLI